MKLTLEQIKSMTFGAAGVDEKDGLVRLLRFTEAEAQAYKGYNSDFYKKTFATAGIRFEFTTNSARLAMKTLVKSCSSRYFFAHSVYVNGELVGRLEDKCDNEINGDYEGEWALGEGEKTVKIYFPWSVSSSLYYLELDDGATFSPAQPKKRKMIIYGDSITHGYDASVPENSYASKLADALDADAVNKGIGGEVFFPTLASLRADFEPDIITVAYGTNDWARGDIEAFDRNSKLFYEALSKNYPSADIFALSPIWRGDTSRAAQLLDIAAKLQAVADSLPNVTLINCYDFVPHAPEYFSPDILHPNDKGFVPYAENVIKAIKG